MDIIIYCSHLLLWVPVNLIGKVSNGWIRDLEIKKKKKKVSKVIQAFHKL